ncbi:secreted RxLR effector protein 161-like [Nicotiana tomentosiformis]|uniref:secreted RxLR effector protein 161-like n=1 Tax=Nicotiana tomentosiformis TaxID=4098 RepID=UPI00388CD1EB
MDIKTTFLNGDLDEEVYMEQPKGFVLPGNEKKVCKLVKSLFLSVLEEYCDASWITSIGDNKSTSGWIFTLGRRAISWASKKQMCITHSTTESEFIALAAAGREAEWLRNLLLDIEL